MTEKVISYRRPRPSRKPKVKYNERTARRLCELVAEGQPLSDIAKRRGFPSHQQVFAWRINPDYKIGDRTFADVYDDARRCAADVLFDEMNVLTTTAMKGTEDMDFKTRGVEISARRLRVDTLKFVCGKLFPRAYGDTAGRSLGDKDTPIHVSIMTYTDSGSRSVGKHDEGEAQSVEAEEPSV